jgi:hypothetical protein
VGPQAAQRPVPGLLHPPRRHPGERPTTFTKEERADKWLAAQRTDIERETWKGPTVGVTTLRAYAVPWLAQRTTLKPRTADLQDHVDQGDRACDPSSGHRHRDTRGVGHPAAARSTAEWRGVVRAESELWRGLLWPPSARCQLSDSLLRAAKGARATYRWCAGGGGSSSGMIASAHQAGGSGRVP